MFSSKSFIISGLTFRTLIHFEFIFVYRVRKCSNFILLHVDTQFSQDHLLKRMSLPPCIFLPHFFKNKVPIGAWVYFLPFYFVPLVYISVFVPVPSEKAMAPYSSTLAWKIPWAEEPGRLQSLGSLRVRRDWGTSLSLFTFMHWRRKWQPTPVFLPGESQERGSLVGCRLWGRTEPDTTEVT